MTHPIFIKHPLEFIKLASGLLIFITFREIVFWNFRRCMISFVVLLLDICVTWDKPKIINGAFDDFLLVNENKTICTKSMHADWLDHLAWSSEVIVRLQIPWTIRTLGNWAHWSRWWKKWETILINGFEE